MLPLLLYALVDGKDKTRCWFPDTPEQKTYAGGKKCIFPSVFEGKSSPGCAPRKVLGFPLGYKCQTEAGGEFLDCSEARNCDDEQSEYITVPHGLIAANDESIPPLLRQADNTPNTSGVLISRAKLMEFGENGGGLGLSYCPPNMWPRKDMMDEETGKVNIRLVPGDKGEDTVNIIGCYEKKEDDNDKCWADYESFETNPCAKEDAATRCKEADGLGEQMKRCCPVACGNLGPRVPAKGFRSEKCEKGAKEGCHGLCGWDGDKCVKMTNTFDLKNNAVLVSCTPIVALLLMML